MADPKVDSIHNVAFVGHGNTGKTSLIEQALHLAGATKRLGSVDEKNSHLDFDAEERERGHSIDAAVAHCQWNKALIQFVDTPGYPDFLGAAVSGLVAADAAAIVIHAGDGIQVNTRRMWEAASEAGAARIVIFNRMDGENIDFDALLAQVREVFGSECVPFNLPVMSPDFTAVVDVLGFSGEAPEGTVGDPAGARDSLIESVVETDEELMERYLGDEQIGPQELASAFRKAIVAGEVVPVFCCSAATGAGVRELLDAVTTYLPTPADAPPRKAVGQDGEAVEVAPDPGKPVVATVFKTVSDPFVGKMSFLRILSGTLGTDASPQNARTGNVEKVQQLLRPFGKETESINQAKPGELVVVPKLEDVALFDTLCEGDVVSLPAPQLPNPMVSLALEPKSRADEQRLSQSLEKLGQEDASFTVSRDPQTHELVVRGMSNLHLEVILSRLKQRFNVEVSTKEPKIPYLETITAEADAMHRHKKQTGGRGQFGEVWLRVYPLERGTGFEFVNAVTGGAIPNQFIPSVEKGVQESLQKGILAGYPIQDVRVEVYDGKHHPVDSSDAAFKIAGSMAFRKAFEQGKPVLLEPVVNVEITVPSENMGDISGDLVSRRGRISGMDSLGDMQVVRAQAPLAEMRRYATELRSITGGQGYFTMEFSHYDVVPAHIAEAVIADAQKEKEQS